MITLSLCQCTWHLSALHSLQNFVLQSLVGTLKLLKLSTQAVLYALRMDVTKKIGFNVTADEDGWLISIDEPCQAETDREGDKEASAVVKSSHCFWRAQFCHHKKARPIVSWKWHHSNRHSNRTACCGTHNVFRWAIRRCLSETKIYLIGTY